MLPVRAHRALHVRGDALEGVRHAGLPHRVEQHRVEGRPLQQRSDVVLQW
ncbi:hypothetical protein ACIBG4_30790 [Nonomuraea sp. NPDC050383]